MAVKGGPPDSRHWRRTTALSPGAADMVLPPVPVPRHRGSSDNANWFCRPASGPSKHPTTQALISDRRSGGAVGGGTDRRTGHSRRTRSHGDHLASQRGRGAARRSASGAGLRAPLSGALGRHSGDIRGLADCVIVRSGGVVDQRRRLIPSRPGPGSVPQAMVLTGASASRWFMTDPEARAVSRLPEQRLCRTRRRLRR